MWSVSIPLCWVPSDCSQTYPQLLHSSSRWCDSPKAPNISSTPNTPQIPFTEVVCNIRHVSLLVTQLLIVDEYQPSVRSHSHHQLCHSHRITGSEYRLAYEHAWGTRYAPFAAGSPCVGEFDSVTKADVCAIRDRPIVSELVQRFLGFFLVVTLAWTTVLLHSRTTSKPSGDWSSAGKWSWG